MEFSKIKSSKIFISLIFVSSLFLFIFLRLFKLNQTLFFYNDIGRDLLVLHRWFKTLKPPLLGPQTSALAYNQSAIYFYLLMPLYLLTNLSPLSTIYTALIFYLIIFISLFFILRKKTKLQLSLIVIIYLISLHPEFIMQNRFVWNPTFLGPIVLLILVFFEKLKKNFTKKNLWFFSIFAALATALNYSVAPLFLSFLILAWFNFSKKQNLKIWLYLILSLFIVNLPTFVFELRHKFFLTKLLFTGETFLRERSSFKMHLNHLVRLNVATLKPVLNYLIAGLITLAILFNFYLNKKVKSKQQDQFFLYFKDATILLGLTILITMLTPFEIEAHYIFGVLTMVFVTISLVNKKLMLPLLLILTFYWLQPTVTHQYLKPPLRTLDETWSCAKQICALEKAPMFLSVQGPYPYHNGMDFKYLFTREGCDIRELDTQINEANLMSVIEDHDHYEHGKTAYNELTQFGQAKILRKHQCNDKIQVYILEKN